MAVEVGTIPAQDIVMKQGSAFQWTIAVTDAVGVDQDLTGWSAPGMQIRTSHRAGTLIADVSAYVALVSSQIQIDVPDTVTDDWDDWTDGYYDVIVTDPSGQRRCIVQGRVRVDPRVTQ